MVCSGGCDFGDTSDNVRTRDISFMTILCVFAQATYSNKSPAQGDFFAAGKSWQEDFYGGMQGRL